MTVSRRSIVPFLGLLLLAPPALRGAEPPDWVRDAPGRAEYPHQEALCLRRHVTLELKPDGRRLRRVFTAVKVLLPIPFGRTGLADPRVHFDAENQEIRVLQARTWLPSGQARDTGESGKNVVFPDALAQAPDLARFRDLVVTHLGIQEGAVAVFEYEIEDRRPPAWPFEGTLETQMPIPTLELEVRLSAPEDAGLQVDQLAPAGRRLALERKSSEGRTRFVFTGKALPAAPRESDRIVFGTRSWPELEALLAGRRRALGTPAGELAARVAATKEQPPLARAEAVARILQEGLTLVPWPEDLLQFQVRPAERVWRSTYASALEMAGLLAACLELAGLEEVRLHPIFRQPSLALPCLAAAGEYWVSAALPGEPPLWIQAGGLPGAPEESALAGTSVLIGPPPVPGTEGFSGSLALRARLELRADGRLEGSVDVELAGSALAGLQARLRGLEPQMAPLARCLGAAGLEGLQVLRLDRSGASARFSLKGSLKPGPGGLRTLTLALPPGSPAGLPGLHLLERAEPIQVPGGSRRESLELTLKLPPGWRLAAGPPALELMGELGRVERSCEAEAGAVRLRYLLELEAGRMEPEQWPSLRALLAPLWSPAAWTLVLDPQGA